MIYDIDICSIFIYTYTSMTCHRNAMHSLVRTTTVDSSTYNGSLFVRVIIFSFTRRVTPLSLSDFRCVSSFIFLRGFLEYTYIHRHTCNIIKRIGPMNKERKKSNLPQWMINHPYTYRYILYVFWRFLSCLCLLFLLFGRNYIISYLFFFSF